MLQCPKCNATENFDINYIEAVDMIATVTSDGEIEDTRRDPSTAPLTDIEFDDDDLTVCGTCGHVSNYLEFC